MVYNVGFDVIDASQQNFVPGAFGAASQVVLNTTSFDDILAQLQNVVQSYEAQQEGANPPTLSLISTGCYTNATSEQAEGGTGVETGTGTGYRDCAAACSDPAEMFNSSYTFWNCLTLGAASLYVNDQDLIIDTASLADAGATMGFDGLDQFNSTQIFKNAIQCITGSCQDYSLGSCSSNISTLDISGASNQVLALYDGLQDYCAGMDSVVNSDIAGPGVVISYILQAALSIAIYVLINLFTSWLQPLLSLLYTIQDCVSRPRPARTAETVVGLRRPVRTPWERAGEHQRAIATSRAAAALTSGLVEFQEAQAFFVLSIQFATLIIFASDDNAAMLSSTDSFAEAVVNVEAVQMLSINGLLPVLFTQVGLMNLGFRWWYMTLLVVTVFVMTVLISQKSLMPDYDELWAYFKAESPITMCGGNPSPMTYCLSSLTGINDALIRMNSGLYVSLGVMPAILVDQLWHFLNRHGRMDEALDSWELTTSRVMYLRRRVWPKVKAVLWFTLQLTLVIYVGLYAKSLRDILKFVGTSSSDWTFGQLIAMMVWAPVVGKYAYYNLFGITEGVGRRLTSRYKVVEVDDDDRDEGGKGGKGGTGGKGPRPGPGKPQTVDKEWNDDIEMDYPRKNTFQTSFSREDTLVAALSSRTTTAAFDHDAATKAEFARKNNPFDRHGGKFDDM